MSELVIETSGLTKRYAERGERFAAVDGLDLEVPAGAVHALLGPDGAGKTTTLRMLLGLATPTSGAMRLFGRHVPRHLPEVMPRIGATVERPAFSGSISGRRSLVLLARAAGVPTKRVDEALERVGLAGRRHTRFRSYSAGMRQRLALASALLRTPELLVLDEPTHRLDPAGARDVWSLVQELATGGTTVLLTTHDLAEVQQVCRTVTIMGEGRTLASGPVIGLVGEGHTRTRVGTDDPDRAERALRDAGFGVRRDGDDVLVEGHEHPEEISRALAGEGIWVRELSAVRPDLESVFLELTADSRDQGSEAAS